MREKRGWPGAGTAVAAVLILALAGCAGSAATVDTRGGGDDLAMFAGTWEGILDASDFSAEMSLVLNHADGTVTGSVTLSAMGETMSAEMENFENEGMEFTSYFYMSGGDVYVKGALDGDKMTGTFQVFVEGNMEDEGTWNVTRK